VHSLLERVLIAAALCVVATISLIIGAAMGLYLRPSPRVTAAVMAFGSGALIQALSVNLAFEGVERLLHQAHLPPFLAWSVVAAGFFAGGLLFYLADRWIEKRGGALRSEAKTKAYLLEKKRDESAATLARLAKVDLLRALPPEEVQEIVPFVHSIRVPAGEVLFRAGDPGTALYLVEKGCVDIVAGGRDPERSRLPEEGYQPIARLGPGDAFGEIALVSGEPRTASAVATEDSDLLRIEKEDFDNLMFRSEALREAVNALSMERLMNTARAAPVADAHRWQEMALRGMRRMSRAERASLVQKEAHGGGVPIAIFAGSLLDGIPECIVIGAMYRSLSTFNPTFLIAVFLADLAEAMSSAAGMRLAGFSARRILGMWSGAVVASAIAGALGNAFLIAAPPMAITFVEALAGGAILGMIAATMMPVAFEEGGPTTGLATIAGFLSTFLVTAFKIA
jgi:CRP-like cAMP-binding protein